MIIEIIPRENKVCDSVISWNENSNKCFIDQGGTPHRWIISLSTYNTNRAINYLYFIDYYLGSLSLCKFLAYKIFCTACHECLLHYHTFRWKESINEYWIWVYVRWALLHK